MTWKEYTAQMISFTGRLVMPGGRTHEIRNVVPTFPVTIIGALPVAKSHDKVSPRTVKWIQKYQSWKRQSDALVS